MSIRVCTDSFFTVRAIPLHPLSDSQTVSLPLSRCQCMYLHAAQPLEPIIRAPIHVSFIYSTRCGGPQPPNSGCAMLKKKSQQAESRTYTAILFGSMT